ncbi:MAG TPA: YfiR family protein [Candidatus Angelobacter sp.]
MSKLWQTSGKAIALLLLGGALARPAVAQSATEDQVKAAYLFNFAKFIEWPPEAFETADSALNFCTLGRSPVVDELDSSMLGKSINRHAIAVRHLRGPEDIKGCHLVFLAASAVKQQQKLVLAAKGSPMLLVAETPGFAQAGGTINFYSEAGRLLFEVNISAAENAHLKVSSKLLSLARIVTASEAKQGQ